MDDGYICTKDHEELGSARRRIHELATSRGWKYERESSQVGMRSVFCVWHRVCDQCRASLALEGTDEAYRTRRLWYRHGLAAGRKGKPFPANAGRVVGTAKAIATDRSGNASWTMPAGLVVEALRKPPDTVQHERR